MKLPSVKYASLLHLISHNFICVPAPTHTGVSASCRPVEGAQCVRCEERSTMEKAFGPATAGPILDFYGVFGRTWRYETS